MPQLVLEGAGKIVLLGGWYDMSDVVQVLALLFSLSLSLRIVRLYILDFCRTFAFVA